MIINTAIPMPIYPQDIPIILRRFFELADNDNFPKNHRFFPACQYYHKLMKNDLTYNEVPQNVKFMLSEICNILLMSDQLNKKNKIKELSRTKDILTLSAEAQIGSYYTRRGYSVNWLSPKSEDPPDLIICDPEKELRVDIEVKVKEGTFKTKTIDMAMGAIFDSLSKSLKSLNNRKSKNYPAIVAVHADKDLNWPDWLINFEVQKRLESRLVLKEYQCISGIIFSGGDDIKKLKGNSAINTKLVAFRSHVASYPLPKGFLPTHAGEL